MYLCKRFLLMLMMVALMIPIFALPVYAEPDEPSEGDPVGWIEVQCAVPNDFHDPITVVISEDATGEIYTVDCREINGYIGRAKLPAGTYTIFQVDAAPDRPAGCDISTFEITADMKAAQLIQVTVESATGAVLKDDPSGLEDESEQGASDDNSLPPSNGENDKDGVDEVTPESTSQAPASAPGHTAGIIVAVCIVAVIVVAGFVVYMRKRR